ISLSRMVVVVEKTRGRSHGLDLRLEQLQQARPAAVDIPAHLCAALGAHLLELAMLELNPGRIRALGDESHFDLGADRGIRLPLTVDVPLHHEALRWLPRDDPADIRARAVLGKLIPVAAEPRLHSDASARRLADAVIDRPPAAEAGGEDLEGARGARVD